MKFQGSSKEGISRNLLKVSLCVSSEIYECYEEDLRVFQGSFNGILKKLRKFQECFESVSRKFKGCLI